MKLLLFVALILAASSVLAKTNPADVGRQFAEKCSAIWRGQYDKMAECAETKCQRQFKDEDSQDECTTNAVGQIQTYKKHGIMR